MGGYCNKCGRLVTTGLAKHRRLAHPIYSTCGWQGLKSDFAEHSPCSERAGTPVEKLARLSEVLRFLGIRDVDIPWSTKALDALPNGRTHQDLTAFGSSKGDVPHVLDPGQRKPLPLGIDLTWKLTDHLESGEDVTGSFVRDDDCFENSVDALSAKQFIMDITAGSDYRETPRRWLNVSMDPILDDPDFELANRRYICEIYNTDQEFVTLHSCEANILPKFAPVDLHHDTTGGICTARAIQPRVSPPGKVVKLWFFWPHSNTTYLPEYYREGATLSSNI
ncbi:hypothetical protein LTR53_011249 [Teratosphaeriaceae sp. CCFEE 6253]|nr:hypothetical protein LTR53_011249 [Teratosphaeriaceae sp. CCFEE 6253]